MPTRISTGVKRSLYFIGVLILSASPVFSQEAEEVVLPEHVMSEVVQRVVTWYFKPRQVVKKVYVSNRIIKEAWLPEIKGIEFILVTDGPLQNREKGVFFFKPIEKIGRHFQISFGYGDPRCDGYGDTWIFMPTSNRVRLWKEDGLSWGMGCSTGSSDYGPPSP